MEKFTGQNYLFTFTINGYGPGEANLGGTTTQTFQNPKWLYQIESFFQPCLPVYAKLHFLKIYRTEQNFTGLDMSFGQRILESLQLLTQGKIQVKFELSPMSRHVQFY